MSNYTKEDLEGKVRKELVGIAKDLNLSTSGNRADLIDRIFDHKPSFKDMIESAPVSKDGDLNISIEDAPIYTDTTGPDKTEDIPIGVEVNDPYPDQNEETEAEDKEPKAKTEVEIKNGIGTIPPAEEPPLPEGMVSENTAEDILKGWQNTIQGFYRKNTPGIAPARPAQPTAVAKELGIPSAVSVLGTWQAAIISRLRPVRGAAPAPPKTAKDMVQIIKSL